MKITKNPAILLAFLSALSGMLSGPGLSANADQVNGQRRIVPLMAHDRVVFGGACQTAADCDDGVDCTADSCVNDACDHAADHLACSDGLACNGPEYCGSGGCEGHFPPLCGLGQSCDEEANACVSDSNCCGPHGAAGCDNEACSSMVCEPSPQCCTTIWDLSCAAAAAHCNSICSPAPIGLVVAENTAPAAAAEGLVTYRLYVQLNSPNAEVFGVGSSLISTDDPQGFYQDPFGTNFPPNAALCGFFPLVCSDSFITIGATSQNGNLVYDPDFDTAAFNPPLPQNVVTGGWFNAGFESNSLGAPDANLQALIAQFTVHAGFDVSGQMYVLLEDDGSFYLQSFTTVCAPDLNGDGITDASDLALLLGAWGSDTDHSADLNGDGVVNAADLALLLGNWGPCD